MHHSRESMTTVNLDMRMVNVLRENIALKVPYNLNLVNQEPMVRVKVFQHVNSAILVKLV